MNEYSETLRSAIHKAPNGSYSELMRVIRLAQYQAYWYAQEGKYLDSRQMEDVRKAADSKLHAFAQ